MNPIEYFFLQMELEGRRLTRDNQLALRPRAAEGLPLAVIVHTSDGRTLSYFSRSLPADLRKRLNLCAGKIQFPDVRSVVDLLAPSGSALRIEQYRTHCFPVIGPDLEASTVVCLPKDDRRIVDFGFGGLDDRVFAVLENNQVVSACVSARRNAKCAESWVYTAETHRRRGLARQVVRAWARQMRKQNLIPFYSHALENAASAALAEGLGLDFVFEEISVGLSE